MTSDSSRMERAASMMERTVSWDPRLPPVNGTLVDDGMGTIQGLAASSLLLLSLLFEGIEVGFRYRRCSKAMMQFFLHGIVAEEGSIVDTLHFINGVSFLSCWLLPSLSIGSTLISLDFVTATLEKVKEQVFLPEK